MSMKNWIDTFVASWSAKSSSTDRNLRLMRFLCLLEIAVYVGWHFVIQLTQPEAYNPIDTRLMVIIVPTLIFIFSYYSLFVVKNIELLYYASLYILMSHNLYAGHMNYADVAWPVANYITVAAVCACFHKVKPLAYFSVFTFLVGFYITRHHDFIYPFYVPGLFTILFVMNVNLYYRNSALFQLEEAKSRLENLFDAVFEGIALHKEGVIIECNDSFSKLIGCEGEDVSGRSILDFVAPQSLEAAKERIQKPIDTPQQTPFETFVKRKDGTLVPIEVSSKIHFYQGELLHMLAMRDMSERLQIEAEKEKTLEAQAAVRLRDQFISIASHELRTPLTPIKLSNEILLRMINVPGLSEALGSHKAKMVKMLSMCVSQVSRITHLIDDMLDVSRISAGYFALRLQEFNLCELLEVVSDNYVEEVAKNGVTLKIVCSNTQLVYWDRLRAEQILTNLLRNALTYGSNKAVCIRVRSLGDKVVVSFRDRGIGIGADDLARIFNRFERAVPPENYGGLGLGLFIARQIALAHKGEIHVKSKVGQGSRFTVVLPRVATESSVTFRTNKQVSHT